MKSEANSAAILAALEERALAGGYPPGWITLYGSLADDESFMAPARSGVRPVAPLDSQ